MGTRPDVAHSTASGRKSVGTMTPTTRALLGCAGLGLLAAKRVQTIVRMVTSVRNLLDRGFQIGQIAAEHITNFS